jgi:hypothetical protein
VEIHLKPPLVKVVTTRHLTLLVQCIKIDTTSRQKIGQKDRFFGEGSLQRFLIGKKKKKKKKKVMIWQMSKTETQD